MASLSIRGMGYWRFNALLLEDIEYIEMVKTIIKNTIFEYCIDGDMNDYLDVELSINDQLFFLIT